MSTEELKNLRLSQSVVSSYMGCPYRFELTYLKKIRPRFTPAPLRRGTLVHAGLEAAFRTEWRLKKEGLWGAYRRTRLPRMVLAGRRSIEDKQRGWLESDAIRPFLTPELVQVAEQLNQDSKDIFERSFRHLGVHEGEWETVTSPVTGEPMIELEMTIPWDGFAEAGGTADLVAREASSGKLWLWDFKTGAQVQSEVHYETQVQAPFYIELLKRQHSLDVVGSINYLILSKVLKKPNLLKLKKGQERPDMSRADVRTDWATYRSALIENGLDPVDYANMREKLSKKVFQRIDKYFRTRKEVVNVWNTVVEISESMVSAEGTYPRNLNAFTCGFCKMKEFCLADLRGHDTEFLSRTTFMKEGETAFYHLEIEEE